MDAVGLPERMAGRLARGRMAAESRMLDTFDIKISLGWAPDLSGDDVETFELLFTTPGRVKVEGGLAVRDAEVGGRTSASVVRSLHIPVAADPVPPGAVAFCTAVHATSDPSLLGARLTIGGAAPGSQTTARRLEVTEVLS